MTPHEIVIDACKQGGSPLSEAQKIFVAGSVAVLIEKAVQDEREACAQIGTTIKMGFACSVSNHAADSAIVEYIKAIRERSK